MTARKNKGINFSPEEHMVISTIRRKMIASKNKDYTMSQTVMEGIRLLERKIEK